MKAAPIQNLAFKWKNTRKYRGRLIISLSLFVAEKDVNLEDCQICVGANENNFTCGKLLK